MLESERVITSSPMSYSGSARRLWRLLVPLAPTSGGARVAVLPLVVALTICITMAVWFVVTAWYAAMLIMFGPLLFIFRLFRRGSRREKAAQRRHRELLEATRRR